MKKIAGFIMLVVLVMSMKLSAKTNFYINASAAIPVSDFAYGYNEKTCTLLSDKGWGGGAGVGANLDFKIKFNIGVKGLGVFLSLDGIYNGLNQDMNDYFDNMKYQLYEEVNSVMIDIPYYLHASAMTGLNYVYEIRPKFGVFWETGIGANFRYISDLYLGAINDDFGAVEFAHYDPKFSLAFQVGTGVEINKRFVFGVSFYYLGSARVQGEDHIHVWDEYDSDENRQYFRFNNITPMLIMARYGVKFGK